MKRVYVGVGSNLDNPVVHVKQGLHDLRELPESQWVVSSSLYKSTPMGPQDQPDFINAVAAVDTLLAADDFLQAILAIEKKHGRVRDGQRWGPRTLDLDLLLYGDEVITKDSLTVPHPGISNRAFVVIPLAEIAPDLHLPKGGSLSDLKQKFAGSNLILV